jgi:hypothetical protein
MMRLLFIAIPGQFRGLIILNYFPPQPTTVRWDRMY